MIKKIRKIKISPKVYLIGSGVMLVCLIWHLITQNVVGGFMCIYAIFANLDLYFEKI